MRTALAAAVHERDSRPPSGLRAVPSRPEPRAMGVLIVDDDHTARYSLWALLNWQSGLGVGVTSGADAAAVVQRERPAVCLVSAGLGLRYIPRLTLLPDGPRVLVYAERPAAGLDGLAVIAGAEGAVWRYGDPVELVATIRRAAAGPGRPVDLAPATIHRLLDRVEDRDRPIAAMLMLRTPFDDIARTLGISAGALRARRHELIKRLGDAARV